ncbi:MAG: hypothetical protein LBK01_00430, partial [Burkholderiaceae bacterium]|nr:hypothetical protein [Burkholderiaceae bacterium]
MKSPVKTMSYPPPPLKNAYSAPGDGMPSPGRAGAGARNARYSPTFAALHSLFPSRTLIACLVASLCTVAAPALAQE